MKKFPLRNELLLHLIESAQDGIVLAEKEGDDTILVYVNPAFEKLTGYTAEEILFQDCRFLQGNNREQDAVRIIRAAVDANRPVRTVLKNYRKDGTLFWNELSVTPYYDQYDKLTYYIGIQKDVTEEMALREALEQAQQELAALKGKA